jgi:hypothetical protein
MRDLDKRSDALSCLYHMLLLQEIGVSDEVLKHKALHAPRSYEIRAKLKHFGLLDAPQDSEAADHEENRPRIGGEQKAENAD